ncbi:MAG: ABC transporter permease [Oscillospiraceae bacterium]
MKKFIIKRFFSALAVLVGVSILSFLLIELSGRDPAEVLAMKGGRIPDKALVEEIRAEMGFDKPVHIRYINWVKGFFTGNMGTSITTYKPISQDLAENFPVTLALVGMALVWIVIIAFPAAVLSVRFHNGVIDHLIRTVTMIGICLPVFWLGFLLLLLLAVKIPLFSVVPKAGLSGYILPSFALAFPSACAVVRLFRSSLLQQLSSDHAVFARTRGLSEWRIIICHAMRNALPPIVTLVGQYLGYLIAGSAVAESVFSIKGIGSYLVSCVTNGDSYASAACILIIATIFVASNLASDIINRLLCPWMVRETND